MSEPCAIVIPAWNESLTIGPLVQRGRAQCARVIVVDDGSTDETGALAEAAGAMVLGHARNLGKGAALRTGLHHARRQGCGWAITLDADGQHPPEDIPALRERAATTRAALVVGSRMSSAGEMPWLRRAANRWMSRQLSHRAGQFLPDSQCGFRLLQLEAWARLPLRTNHFEVESETLLAFLRAGYRVEFVPIAVRPAPRPSRIQPIRDSARWLRWWHQSDESVTAPVAKSLPADSLNVPLPRRFVPAPFRHPWLLGALRLLVIGLLLGWVYGWVGLRLYPPDTRFGFGWGMAHGACMPMALPALLMGRDVSIYSEHNTGRGYKLGYIAGINLCGLVFFGGALWKPRRQPAAADAPVKTTSSDKPR